LTAVEVSEGGGAEGVSELQARDAIRHGIAIESAGSLLKLNPFRIQMAYRQAALFVAFLHDTSPAGVARMMDTVLDGHPFAEAVMVGYETDIDALWTQFLQASQKIDWASGVWPGLKGSHHCAHDTPVKTGLHQHGIQIRKERRDIVRAIEIATLPAR
jgi:hypothetical protein